MPLADCRITTLVVLAGYNASVVEVSRSLVGSLGCRGRVCAVRVPAPATVEQWQGPEQALNDFVHQPLYSPAALIPKALHLAFACASVLYLTSLHGAAEPSVAWLAFRTRRRRRAQPDAEALSLGAPRLAGSIVEHRRKKRRGRLHR